jgi:hypothetical protein
VKVLSSAILVPGRSCWASVTNRQSTTVSWAIRLVVAPDGDQDPGVSPGVGSRLLFGHAARLPVSIVKSVVVRYLPMCRKTT